MATTANTDVMPTPARSQAPARPAVRRRPAATHVALCHAAAGRPHLAEDAVQEAFVGALRGSASFAGRAAYRSWVFAHPAAQDRRPVAGPAALRTPRPTSRSPIRSPTACSTRRPLDGRRAPADWGDPQAALQDTQFWRVFEACLDHLPGQQARVFMMREFVELDSPEICSAVGISTSNLNVSLHRARLRLRSCLEQHWFGEGCCSTMMNCLDGHATMSAAQERELTLRRTGRAQAAPGCLPTLPRFRPAGRLPARIDARLCAPARGATSATTSQ